MNDRVLFIVGPTAIGKTEIAVLVARKINAEIICCDSMQVYKGMPVLTSMPQQALLRRVAHHLFSVISPSKEFNVSAYRALALKKVRAVLKRGKVPLFVGGSGLYMKVLLDGIFEEKIQDDTLRDKLYQEAQKIGNIQLYARLKKIDPLAATKIHPNDTRRLVRALEVFTLTGKPISLLQKNRSGLDNECAVTVIGLTMNRDALYARIDQRVECMLKQGLLEEVARLKRRALSKTASCAIGFKELAGFRDGAYDLAEAIRLIKRNTRHYAKRQLTWFKKETRLSWIAMKAHDKPNAVASKIIRLYKAHTS
ncbi:MAG: tRNA (adenosine(37)-N6)-dimethylallyltransferase MiaA [Candidatus Omnitrophica bacterium]|nr:tRNA (adenosine(37)-N6)-dimethylallyltransferase MiaA [Candidatus Omnitrophota bacterium]